MKKNLPFSLIVLFTVFTVISCYDVYQSHSFQYKTYCINNIEQKNFVGLNSFKSFSDYADKSMNDIAGIAKKTHELNQPECTLEYLMANKLKKEEQWDMEICLSQPGDEFDDNNKVSDIVLTKETNTIGLILGNHSSTFFDNPLICINKKSKNISVTQVGRAGRVLDSQGFEFAKFSDKKLAKYHTISVSQKTEG